MAEKTEQPSGKKLSDARDKGNVPRSLELNSAAALLGGALLLMGPGKSLVSALKVGMLSSINSMPTVVLNEAWLRQIAYNTIVGDLPNLGLILVGMLVIGIAVTEGQTNFMWSSQKLSPDLNRLNPIEGFKRIFSSKGLIELGRSLIKLVVVGWVAVTYLQSRETDLLAISQVDLATGISRWIDLASTLVLRVGGVYLIVAIADYIYQRWNFSKSLRMTKEEVKEEYKQQEGDPMIKGRIRGMQRRMARMRMMSNVQKATVVVTNPTHLAIALEYNPDMNAPRVLAKGAYHMAERLIAIARENNIPVVQNIPLARAIYRHVEVDQEITPDLYLAMAEVLAYVYKVRKPSMQAAQA